MTKHAHNWEGPVDEEYSDPYNRRIETCICGSTRLTYSYKSGLLARTVEIKDSGGIKVWSHTYSG